MDRSIHTSLALINYEGTILTLQKTFNLRIHPVFKSKEYVWGPIHIVHNHQYSRAYINEFQIRQPKTVENCYNLH